MTDVVCLGLGHMSGPVAAELTLAGYNVVGIEKGPFWNFATDWSRDNKDDEWAIAVERKFDHPLFISSFSIRNTRNQFALPVRRYTKQVQYHALGHGVGGVGVHYGGGLGRFAPWSYQAFSETEQKYGTSILPSDHDMEDFPVTYDEMRPYYDAWEKMLGVSGDNEDPFCPGVSYPTPPHPFTPAATMFKTAAQSLGYHPFAHPTGLISTSYTNQYGLLRNACVHCGWCGGACNYPCEVGAKGSSHVASIPAAQATGKFDMRLNAYVFRIDLDESGKKATGVRYYDYEGKVHVQPAKVVFNGIWGYNIIRLMLLSGAGKPYDAVNATGTVGRGLSEGYAPSTSGASGVLNIGSNDYCAGNAAGGGYAMLDLSDDNFDHTGLNFIGGMAGNYIGDYRGSGPGTITSHLPGLNNFGSTWKAGLKDEKLPANIRFGIGTSGPAIPTKGHFVDLDPHYNDIYGDPQARITLDWDVNPYRVGDYMAPKVVEILTKMGATNITTTKVPELSQHVDWWGHHMRGGCRTGKDPATSVFNKWMQAWDVENLFASGEICFPFGDNITNGTHPAGAMAYLAADGIKKYLMSPGSLM
jgi:gluconate 2-dehydrogenase alpha chain